MISSEDLDFILRKVKETLNELGISYTSLYTDDDCWVVIKMSELLSDTVLDDLVEKCRIGNIKWRLSRNEYVPHNYYYSLVNDHLGKQLEIYKRTEALKALI